MRTQIQAKAKQPSRCVTRVTPYSELLWSKKSCFGKVLFVSGLQVQILESLRS